MEREDILADGALAALGQEAAEATLAEPQSKYAGMNYVNVSVAPRDKPPDLKRRKLPQIKGLLVRCAVFAGLLGVLFGFKFCPVPALRQAAQTVKQVVCQDILDDIERLSQRVKDKDKA